jgi:hypothetical protein
MGTDTMHAHTFACNMTPHIKKSRVQLVSLEVTLTTYNLTIKFL